LSEWWANSNSTPNCNGAQAITVTAGQTVSGKNFQLDTGATISGTIFKSDGVTPITGTSISIDAYSGDPCGSVQRIKGAFVEEADGTFMISGLPAGSFYLEASTDANYVSEIWAAPNSTIYCSGAQAITVTAGQAVSGKNFQLDVGAIVSGTVFQSDGITPLIGKSIWVAAFAGDPCGSRQLIKSTYSSLADGTYTIAGLPSGTGYLQASSNENYVSEWWATPSSTPNCGNAQAITVTGGQTFSDNNFQLDTGATISGTVFKNDGVTPITGELLLVDAYAGNPCGATQWIESAFVNQVDGIYTVVGLPTGSFYLKTSTSENYLSEWWASPYSTSSCNAAQSIAVSEKANVTMKNFQLDQQGGVAPGDVNSDGVVNLEDVILILKLLSGNSDVRVNVQADVNSDSKIGLADVIYILRKVSGLIN
jgi:hypothetical protein